MKISVESCAVCGFVAVALHGRVVALTCELGGFG